jgi:CDP-diacylglycerol---serine O-phosphatidyltransferase
MIDNQDIKADIKPEVKKGIVIYLMPNILTTCSLFLGFFSIIRAVKLDFDSSAYAIIIASVFDALDGRVARITGGASSFGEQYDSLSDAISFGVAPAVLMYMWSLNSIGRVGWLACFLFIACGALRLARFNVLKGSIEKKFFQGLPIPMAAVMIASSVLFFEELQLITAKVYYMLALTFLLAGLMVSSLRYKNFKNVDRDKRKSFFTLVGAIIVITIIAENPSVNLFFFVLAYIVMGIVANIFKWKKYKEAIDELREMERIEKEEIDREEREGV